VVVALLLGGFLVLRGGGGGGGASGMGTFKGTMAANGAFVHHVDVPAGSALLIKVIPEGQIDTLIGLAADFPTIDKYTSNFGFTAFGGGQVNTDSSNASLGSIDLSAVKGGLFYDQNTAFGPAAADPVVVPAPFAASLDIVITAADGSAGNVTLQVETRKFTGPDTTADRGNFFVTLMNRAYRDFLNSATEIQDTKDFTKQSDFTDNSDFSDFSDSFSLLDGLPK
jgi:hypothetical protein